MGIEDVGDIVSREAETVREWIRDFEDRRLASIFTGHEDNENAAKLTRNQKEEIKKILQEPPSKQKLPRPFWDVPSLKRYTEATFGVVYESARSYHFLLEFSALSFKYPSTFDRRRDEKKIRERMKEIQEEIAPFLKDPGWEVFASDEVRIEREALKRRAWLKRGEPTILKVDRKKDAQNYIGFLNQKTFACHLLEMARQNQDEVLKAFKSFLQSYPEKRICIVWDNAAFHKGQKIREALKRGGVLSRVHLIPMPPYAPDCNPIEHVWKEGKANIANLQRDDLEQTKQAFKGYIEGRAFKYQIRDFVLR